MKHSQELMQDKIVNLQSELQRSESRCNQLELQLQNFKPHHTGNESADNYIREELSRLRKESNRSQDKIRELKKTVSNKSRYLWETQLGVKHSFCLQVTFLESEKADLERRLLKSPNLALTSPGVDRVDKGSNRKQNGGEHLVRIKILEQENDRLQKKIRGLESQLTELEKAHGDRIQVF